VLASDYPGGAATDSQMRGVGTHLGMPLNILERKDLYQSSGKARTWHTACNLLVERGIVLSIRFWSESG
jgi:hypothetical protein